MTNLEIARLLRQIAAALILKGENRFRIIAYEKAADVIETSAIEAKDLWQDGRLASLPGIGASLTSHLDELFRTGKVRHFDSVFKGLPSSLFPLLDVPGFGPKRAYKLVQELHLRDPATVIDDLSNAARKGKIASIPGFGSKSQQDIIAALERFKKGQVKEKRMPLPYAHALALEMIAYLKGHKDTLQAVMLGSLRRMVATIGDIDIAVTTYHPEAVIDWFIRFPKAQKIVEKGPSGATILLNNGRQIDLRVADPEKFGAMLQYFTGSKNHNIKLREFALKKGLSLSEYGIKLINQKSIRQLTDKTSRLSGIHDTAITHSSQTASGQNYNSKLKIYEYPKEEEFYHALDLSWIPPELREDTGEIEAALRQAQGKPSGLPKLVEANDIKGDLHIHSNYDLEPSHDLGRSSIEEILVQAEKLHYEYIGISDHNPSNANHSKDKILSIMKRRKEVFEHIMRSTKSVRVHLFIMLETDILPDGKLALPDEAFTYLDATIVSIHSSFHMDKLKMTERILTGLSHPKAKIFAHPTGRLIGNREGYELDWEKLFTFCQDHDKAIEINAYPDRLDLPDALVREAIKSGVKLIIDTDSHEVSQMQLMRYGVSVARRGWGQKSDILNALPYNRFKNWLLKD